MKNHKNPDGYLSGQEILFGYCLNLPLTLLAKSLLFLGGSCAKHTCGLHLTLGSQVEASSV